MQHKWHVHGEHKDLTDPVSFFSFESDDGEAYFGIDYVYEHQSFNVMYDGPLGPRLEEMLRHVQLLKPAGAVSHTQWGFNVDVSCSVFEFATAMMPYADNETRCYLLAQIAKAERSVDDESLLQVRSRPGPE